MERISQSKHFIMKKLIYPIILMAIVACGGPGGKDGQGFKYPDTKKVDTVDTYFGETVADPYRWLEDDNSEETKEWVKAQNAVTNDFLANIPYRNAIKERYTELWNYPKSSSPFKSGGLWFMYKNDGLQNQSVLYRLGNYDDEEGEIFIDPNQLSDGGTVSMTNFSVSDDGKYAVYGLSTGGSDWKEFRMIDIASNEPMEDVIKWVKFSGAAWQGDGFYYSRYPAPAEGDQLKGVNENSKVYFHKAGTPQEADQLVYEDTENPLWGFGAYLTEDREILVMSVTESTSGNGLYFKNLKTGGAMVKVVEDFENDFSVVDHANGKLLVMTNAGAPNYKLISIDTKNPSKENWVDVIPESREVLSGISIVGNKMIVTYMKDAHDVCKVYSLTGQFLHDIDIPVLGSVGGFGGKKEYKFTFYSVSSFTTPSTVYRYDVENNRSDLFKESEIRFNTGEYITRQIFYESADGTKVPMFIVHHQNAVMDGTNPCILYGYGGFNISLTPSFSMRTTVWLENGGIYAVANLRGGGEYGEAWHDAGTKMRKQNVFDDFIAASRYLIDNRFTSRDKMAIMGGSNGGLLVGAVTNQLPEGFAVAIPAVGVMDMLRYHKFTIGRYWATDYGTSEDSPEMFKYLRDYSPLHSIKEGANYPAVLVTTADHDDRVVPAHSFKYIAALQDSYKGENPVMIRIATDAGHGAGTPTMKTIEEYADIISFIMYNMDMKPKYAVE